jgi:hypothetical protein
MADDSPLALANHYTPTPMHELAEFFLRKERKAGLWYAGRAGSRAAANYLISQGATNWVEGVKGAAEYGHPTLLQFFLQQAAGEDYKYLLRIALYYATLGGQRELIDYLVSQGAHAWEEVLLAAARSGRRDLLDLALDKGARQLNWALSKAAEGGHLALIHYLISRGANDWLQGLEGAKRGNHPHLREFFQRRLTHSS